jgi:hypothetical protein
MTRHRTWEFLFMSAFFAARNEDCVPDHMLLLCCPRCENGLTLHQPDPQLADRLLATCEDCKSWYLTDGNGDSLKSVARPRIRLAYNQVD